jgi:hypothetical protein
MSSRNVSVFGIYPDHDSVANGVEVLKHSGFRNTDISVLFPENAGSKDLGHEKHSKAPEGVVAGASSGAIIGGALGWLVGIGAISIPGIGAFVAAGPIVSVLSGIGMLGTVGGLTGGLIGVGIPEYEVKRYEGRIRGGEILLSVHCDSSDWVKRAKELLAETGAIDIAAAGEAKAQFAISEKPIPRRNPA